MKYLFLVVGSLMVQFAMSQNFPNGEVIDTIYCSSNPAQSYSLYLPKGYNPNKQWPIIYIFEPAARGKIPVGIFKQAAEAYGYILVSSNNAKNGSWQIVFEAARAMKKDTELKFSINKERVYTAGFSGGSRSAMVMAKAVFAAKGIIANAGAYPTKKQYLINAKDSIAYVGLVGNLDMNYLEHLKLAKELNEQSSKNFLIISDKPHQWISAEEATKAVQWMEMTTNPNMNVEQKNAIMKEFEVWGDSILASTESVFNVKMLTGLEEDWDLNFNIQPSVLLASKHVQKELRVKQKAEAKEQEQLSYYMKAFSSLHSSRFNTKLDSVHTKNWWRLEVDKLKKKEHSKKKYLSYSAQRLSNYLWASFAENSFWYEGQANYEFALQLNSIWQYAQPESVWASYSRARIYASAHRDQEALKELNHAHELGMSRKASLMRESAFNHLKTYEQYQTLLEQLE